MNISAADRAEHEAWLLALTQIPTAAGRESRVIRWIEAWATERPDVTIARDAAGNLTLSLGGSGSQSGGAGFQPAARPLYITAHLDHPAFVVVRADGPRHAVLEFRGGVMDDYFEEARVVIHGRDGERFPATLTGRAQTDEHAGSKCYTAELEVARLSGAVPHDARLARGDIATWDLPAAEIRDGIIYTHACDDLAAVAAALGAFDIVRRRASLGEPLRYDVRLLFTRAEEVGFVGAIAACKDGTVPRNARVINLENSRSFDDSPIGGGPIVRVGDRLTVFSPELTAAVAKVAEGIAGSAAAPTAVQKNTEVQRGWKWQRKLMPGGACESTVFCAAGYEATCICLPLGNYHNMADLAAVQAGTNTGRPRVGPEYVSIADFHGLVDLLVGCAAALPEGNPMNERIEKLWAEKRFVLND